MSLKRAIAAIFVLFIVFVVSARADEIVNKEEALLQSDRGNKIGGTVDDILTGNALQDLTNQGDLADGNKAGGTVDDILTGNALQDLTNQGDLADGEHDPFCLTGIESGDVCCASSCGNCGGSGCGQRDGGNINCCKSNIRNRGDSCTSNEPGCVITAEYGDPFCSTGIFSTNRACCHEDCGSCGGSGCGGRPGGGINCCGGTILGDNNSCDTNEPPCVVQHSVNSACGLMEVSHAIYLGKSTFGDYDYEIENSDTSFKVKYEDDSTNFYAIEYVADYDALVFVAQGISVGVSDPAWYDYLAVGLCTYVCRGSKICIETCMDLQNLFNTAVSDFKDEAEAEIEKALDCNSYGVNGVCVHPVWADFKTERSTIRTKMKNVVDNESVSEIWITGHSMGAMWATYVADDIARQSDFDGIPIKLFGFGSPRPGNDEFASRVKSSRAEVYLYRTYVIDKDHLTDPAPDWPTQYDDYKMVGNERLVPVTKDQVTYKIDMVYEYEYWDDDLVHLSQNYKKAMCG